jgi:hypothetical protein
LFGFSDGSIRTAADYRRGRRAQSSAHQIGREKIMRAVAVSPLGSVRAVAFGLGVASAIFGASLAHGETLPVPESEQIEQALLPPLPNESFICRAWPECGLENAQAFAARSAPPGTPLFR